MLGGMPSKEVMHDLNCDCVKCNDKVCSECRCKPHPVLDGDTSVLRLHWDRCSETVLGNKYAYDYSQLSSDKAWIYKILPQ